MTIEVWLQRRAQRKKTVVELLLFCMSILYGWAILIRHWFYDRGLFSSWKSPLFTVSVGNITAGGSGKTAFLATLIKALGREDKIALLTRGYRSKAEHRTKPTLARNSEGLLASWQEIGDEPYWLARRFEKMQLFIGKKRVKSAIRAEKEGCEILLLDDGMQHRTLARDIEIVIMEGRDPFGGNFFLPKGRLREDPRRIEKADLIVINGTLSAKDEKKIRSLTKASIVQGEMVITKALTREGQEVTIAGEKIALFCALGSPYRYLETLTAYGSQVVATLFLPDHQPIGQESLFTLAQEATLKGAYYICCTEKDGIKMPLIEALKERIVITEAEFEIKGERETFNHFVEQIKRVKE